MRYRPEALAKLGEPEDLDIAPRLVEPRAWIATGVLGVALVVVVVWSFLAGVDRTVTARGIIAPSTGTLVVQSPAAGVLTAVSAHVGDTISADEPVATLLTPDRRSVVITSPFAGRVFAVASAVGEPLSAGSGILDLTAEGADSRLVAELFVPTDQAAQVSTGMAVLLSVEAAPSTAYGLLEGRVQSVGGQTLTPDQSAALLANPVLVNALTGSQPQRLVTVALETARTRSGLAWTSGGGPPFTPPAQTLVNGTIRIGAERPIDFVFGH